MNKVYKCKGIDFINVDSLKELKDGSLITPVKWGKFFNKILFTGTDGIAKFVRCKTIEISINVKHTLIPLKQGNSIRLLEDATIFISTCGNFSFIDKKEVKQ